MDIDRHRGGLQPLERSSLAVSFNKPGGRLDMNHGFVHHIRKNQQARDDYDKEVKEAKEKQKRRHTPAPPRPRKPDIQVYHPRKRGDTDTKVCDYEESTGSSSSTEADLLGCKLFCLEYKADSGKITSVIVYNNDDPDQVVERVSLHNNLDKRMKVALRLLMQEEISKRRSKR
ncbi:UPF0561 protein C2orf68 homolog [Protopterus annectens]|uniref:UPF0561 protein C2orf68 homolog n=1 Tax=Protopterus annectens TaxID=7888 RepID=UPI001CF9F581|nr:UPF0561 protein C2orf68 homolog [Protopterus annectens]